MRIISGKARGHKLFAPKLARPTMDRLKETLFNVLAPIITDAEFLDIFCGSGGIGIEALSRGASSAVFIDESDDAIKTTHRNLEKTRLSSNARVIQADYASGLFQLKGQKFDIIFLDPPYGFSFTDDVLNKIISYGLLLDCEDAVLVLEKSADDETPNVSALELTRTIKQTNQHLLLYKLKGKI
jgi:16S rRNA (guanine(966)-N(2))-methyltransferase RsmD